jgi:hypothetical protein
MDLGIYSTSLPGFEVNGHFCPTTLSIFESVGPPATPPKVIATYDGNVEDMIARLRHSAKELALTTSDRDLEGLLVSGHEHDHFLRFVSTDIGLLLHCVMLVQYTTTFSMLAAMSSQRRRMTLQELHSRFSQSSSAVEDYVRANRIYRVLWLGDASISQGQACSDINWLLQTLGGHSPSVLPDDVNAPAAPLPGIGLLHLLEGSAVMDEELFLVSLGIEGSRMERILHRKERDYRIYFLLRDWLSNSIGDRTTNRALFALRIALDACVTGLLYDTLKGPVKYHTFHPGYRLTQFLNATKLVTPRSSGNSGPDVDTLYYSLPNILETMYTDVTDLMSNAGGCSMFKGHADRCITRSFSDFVSRLDVRGNQGLHDTFVNVWMPTLSYWINSHERLRQKRLSNPEWFLMKPTTQFTSADDYLELWQDPCVTFTYYGNRGIASASLVRAAKLSDSERRDRAVSVLRSVYMRFRMEVVAEVLKGKRLSSSISDAIPRYKWDSNDPSLDKLADRMLQASAQYLRTALGGLD